MLQKITPFVILSIVSITISAYLLIAKAEGWGFAGAILLFYFAFIFFFTDYNIEEMVTGLLENGRDGSYTSCIFHSYILLYTISHILIGWFWFYPSGGQKQPKIKILNNICFKYQNLVFLK